LLHNVLGLVIQVDTAGWLQRTGLEKGPSSLSVMQSRKNLMRAQVVALVLDAEEVCLTFIVLFSSVRRKKFAVNMTISV